MGKVRNILFIMCDQLRWDYLSCTGHPYLETPHIDGLAAKGVNFTRAFVQSPLCGPSRMSFLTGRYVHSHGSSWNDIPLSVGQRNIGDYIRPHGLRCALVGKTHMEADEEGMARLGVDKMSELGVLTAECGLEPYERDDGLWPDQIVDPNYAYNEYLKSKGYNGDNPWHDWANAAEGPNGEILSGWYLGNNHLPARVKEEDSETPIMLLHEPETSRFLPIWIGTIEAVSIAYAQEGYVHPRPQTHDLLIDIIESLNASISEVCITDIQDKTYFAEITLSTIEGSVTLSSRPSDAIALAIRSNSKITVNPDLFNQNSIILIEDDNQEIKDFIEFIDDISPDDFV